MHLVSETWDEMIEKIRNSNNILKNTTELRCTVWTDCRTGEEDVPRILLPHLTKVVLNLEIPDEDEDNDDAVHVQRRNFNLEKYLFFKKEGDDVNINCEVTLNECTFFKWPPAEREVLVGFGRPNSIPFLNRLMNKEVMEKFDMLTIVDNQLPDGESGFQKN